MNSVFYRDTWAEINLDAIYDNVHAMRSYLRAGVKLGAVVKANGYGHGAVEVARTALEAGADFLIVAILDEALDLRQNGIQADILVLGATRAADAAVAVENNIAVTAFQHEWLESASLHVPEGKRLAVHIKCDTGMGRLGFRDCEQVKRAKEIIRNSRTLALQGIYTHFATADELDDSLFQEQFGKFKAMISVLSEKPPIVHCGNSAASLRYQETWFNAIRFGISMYGLSPSMEIKNQLPFPLKEAFSLRTTIVHVKQIEAGATVSYGATYRAEEREWIATLPIGYADGWIRKLQGQEVLIDGQRMPIVGRICMDQCMVKLPKLYPAGTQVTLIGKCGADEISVDEIARKLSTINYEIVCMMGPRIPRKYMRNGEVVFTHNRLL